MRSAEIGPKTGPTTKRQSALATARETPKPASLLGPPSGASRTRTGGLLGAIQDTQRLNVAILQGCLAHDGQISVPKIARNLREFTRVLARGGVRVAKPQTANENGRQPGVRGWRDSWERTVTHSSAPAADGSSPGSRERASEPVQSGGARCGCRPLSHSCALQERWQAH